MLAKLAVLVLLVLCVVTVSCACRDGYIVGYKHTGIYQKQGGDLYGDNLDLYPPVQFDSSGFMQNDPDRLVEDMRDNGDALNYELVEYEDDDWSKARELPVDVIDRNDHYLDPELMYKYGEDWDYNPEGCVFDNKSARLQNRKQMRSEESDLMMSNQTARHKKYRDLWADQFRDSESRVWWDLDQQDVQTSLKKIYTRPKFKPNRTLPGGGPGPRLSRSRYRK